MSLPAEPQSWVREGFLISTDKKLLSIPIINSAFNEDFMYWTKAIPDDKIFQQLIDNSFCFGLYKTGQNTSTTDGIESSTSMTEHTTPLSANPNQIGFARLVTDNITFAYLTDLYVLPGYQGLGLGGWLIDCVDELLNPLPYLRWVMLRTSMQKSKETYEKRLGMGVLESGEISQGPVMMGKRGKAAMT